MTRLAQSSLLSKAKARPDLVRQVVDKARTDGLRTTAAAVRARLDDYMPLGYSGVGTAVEVGEAVYGIRPGQLVATGGAGKANHAEYQAVPGNLCVPVPEGVTLEDAALTTVASIAQHGLRQAELTAGEFVVVIGTGLIGRITLRLARAAGLFAFGIDVSAAAVEATAADGFAVALDGPAAVEKVRAWSHGRGADAVVITAAGKDSSAVDRAVTLCRERANIVIVGDVGLDLDRQPFYDAELSLKFARSYGPGRYDCAFEDWGVDYPLAHVRWTEQRNMESILDYIAANRLQLRDLVTHTFDITDALDAYELVATRSEPFLGIQLRFGDPTLQTADLSTRLPVTLPRGNAGLGLIGAGAFTRGVLLPALRKAGFPAPVFVASGSGLSAAHLAEGAGALKGAATVDDILQDDDIAAVVISTPHSTHSGLVVRALDAGKHVFCEKPLALSFDELERVERAAKASDRTLFTGFNRRWSEAVTSTIAALDSCRGPLVLNYRVNAGTLVPGHWYSDRREGGRLLGEVCHFIDTCEAIVGQPAQTVHALGCGPKERLLSDDVVVTLGYGDGSMATVTYVSHGHRSTAKERLEVLGGGHTVLIDDFQTLTIDGERQRLRRKDKGHVDECQAFLDLVRGVRIGGNPGLSAMRTTLQAAEAMTRPASS